MRANLLPLACTHPTAALTTHLLPVAGSGIVTDAVAIFVNEPDKSSGAPGEIFLWATDLAKGPTGAEPRAYRVPFSEALHARVVEAGNKMRKGLPQIGEVNEEPPGPSARPTDESQGGQKSVAIEFFDLPDPLFPEK